MPPKCICQDAINALSLLLKDESISKLSNQTKNVLLYLKKNSRTTIFNFSLKLYREKKDTLKLITLGFTLIFLSKTDFAKMFSYQNTSDHALLAASMSKLLCG